MAVNLKFTCANSSASTIFDLTSVSINPSAAPTSTPRQGGFTLRNRINWTNVATANKKLFNLPASAAAAQTGNVLRVMEVPERTLVNKVDIFGVKSETVPGAYLTGNASGLEASHLASAAIGIGIEQRSVPASSANYVALSHLDLQLGAYNAMPAGGPFGQIPCLKAGAAVVGGMGFETSVVEAIDASMTAPELGRVKTDVANAAAGSALIAPTPQYFPLGGYIYIGMTNVDTANKSYTSAAKTASTYAYPTGTWDIQAQCQYVPE